MNDFYDDEQQRTFLRAVPNDGLGGEHDQGHDGDLSADPYSVPDVEELLDHAIEDVAAARPAPMSAMVKINRDEILDLLEQARDQLPDELRRARWLLKEKVEFLAKAELERDAIIDQGRLEVIRMVERQEIVRAAESKARHIVEEARTETRQMKRQMEDFCDQKLATFEVLLQRTSATIAHGRSRLLGSAGEGDGAGSAGPGAGETEDEIVLDRHA